MGARNRQKGAVAPLIAVLLLVIVVCVAFVVDLGHIHNVKVELQRAVDAAALAAARQLPSATNVDTVARAVAATNTVDNAPVPVDSASLQVEMGLWRSDTASMGLPVSNGIDNCSAPTDRWDPLASGSTTVCGSSPNAVLVRATRDVEHVFFFFVNDTEVVADAIALKDLRKQNIPVAVTTCIPSGGDIYPGILSPGTSVCDLGMFRFAAGNLDTAAWTSLTIKNANSNNMEYFFGTDGVRLFNEIIYGDGPNGQNPGLEFESVTNDGGCTTDDNQILVNDFGQLINVNVNITCGLGGEFLSTSPRPADPLNYAPLPRWFDTQEFKKVYTMDGTLDQGTENNNDYANRMIALYGASNSGSFTTYNASYSNKAIPEAIQDDRFTRYIVLKNNGDFDYVDSLKILREAGYPEVHLIEGLTETINDFGKMIIPYEGNQFTSSQFSPDVRNYFPPFDNANSSTSGAEGQTVLLYVPIIFTGNCDDATYNKPGIYVGLANVLLTRLWTTVNECFDSGESSLRVDRSCPAPVGYDGKFGSSKHDYTNPSLTGTKLLCTNGFEPKSFEGYLMKPLVDKEAESGLAKYLLVE